jgi:2,5-dioxopentanoate dehydrogenase
MIELTGEMFIAGRRVRGTHDSAAPIDATTGEELAPRYGYAGPDEVHAAGEHAAAAFDELRRSPFVVRAALLERIAFNIEAVGDQLIEQAHHETGLPTARLISERGRTTGQLRLFADLVRQGDWRGPRIDPAQPERTPAPRPDIRQMMIPVGPVAVFGASNFPFAFSVAGGDTASALAAGCPVIVKGHSAHLGTSELIAGAIVDAVQQSGLDAGTFSLLFGEGDTVGQALVREPSVRAVGFTGSRRAGTALMTTAAARPVPIPVFAEMSSVNPVFLLPGALRSTADTLADSFVASLTLGAGQFCTNPGLLFAVRGEGLDRFATRAAEAVTRSVPQTMLTSGIAAAYRESVSRIAAQDGVRQCAAADTDANENQSAGALFVVDAESFLGNPLLADEAFGPAATIVEVADVAALVTAARKLPGQLTATVHASVEDADVVRELLPALELLAGRVLFDGWPTGVEVGHSMVHGGPYPATSDSRATSVGSLAIERFLRPVAYQDVPEEFLPPELQDANPLGLVRRVDGVLCPPR